VALAEFALAPAAFAAVTEKAFPSLKDDALILRALIDEILRRRSSRLTVYVCGVAE
jgi:hypothetical protein